MCFCCQSYSAHTGSIAVVIAPARPMHKGREFLQDTVPKLSLTWVFLPYKHETKNSVKRDRGQRGHTIWLDLRCRKGFIHNQEGKRFNT